MLTEGLRFRPAALAVAFLLVSAIPASEAHRSGCHRWHSCPSDHGTYVCGDLGHCSSCPDNEYCLVGQPRRAAQEEKTQPTPPKGSSKQTGVAPKDAWTCPASHPIKGNFTTYSGERCIYHVQGGQFYSKTKPERCYATEEEARRDGCRRSRR
jgi:hypothetical protein